jgi:hypothetical protein
LRLPALGNVPNGIDELPRHAETAVEGEAKACECSS